MKSTILEHPEFKAFAERTGKLYNQWKAKHLDELKGLEVGADPKALIHDLSEDLLARFAAAELVGKYAVYQLLMDYWAETMQDDVYLIAQDGWKAGNVLRELVAKKGEKLKETPDLVIGKKKYKSDLIPPVLIVARYFAEQQAEVDRLQAEKDAASQELESFIEEHSGEEGLIEDAKNDKGKVTKGAVKDRIKEIKDDREFADELAVLKQCQKLLDTESAASKAVKEAQKMLDAAVFAKYPKLSVDEIKALTVGDKWLSDVGDAVRAEIERVTQQLATRVQTLETRYAETMPALAGHVAELAGKVEGHLKKMGLSW